MGPLELQLYRELAIQMVRQCAEQSRQAADPSLLDLEWRRRWFDLTYEDWTTTQRVELGGLTPAEAILDERDHLGEETPEPSASHVELYTDLPQAEDVGERIEVGDHELVSPGLTDFLGSLERGGERAEAHPDAGPPSSPADQARWRDFCDRHLDGWLEA